MVAIRTARASDVDALAGLVAQLGYDQPAAALMPRLEAMISDPDASVLVAADDAAVVGAAMLQIVPVLHEPGGWCRVTMLVVDERHRGAGTGTALLAAAEDWARDSGCSRIEATSAERRADAHRFYLDRGYGQTSRHFLKRF
jgi:GNAT superfamily N-acetyltransferase